MVSEEYRSDKANLFTSLGRKYYLDKDLDKAIEYSLKGFELEPKISYIQFNLAVFQKRISHTGTRRRREKILNDILREPRNSA